MFVLSCYEGSVDDRLAARLILDPVLGPEPGDDLDGVPTRHCGAFDGALEMAMIYLINQDMRQAAGWSRGCAGVGVGVEVAKLAALPSQQSSR